MRYPCALCISNSIAVAFLALGIVSQAAFFQLGPSRGKDKCLDNLAGRDRFSVFCVARLAALARFREISVHRP